MIGAAGARRFAAGERADLTSTRGPRCRSRRRAERGPTRPALDPRDVRRTLRAAGPPGAPRALPELPRRRRRPRGDPRRGRAGARPAGPRDRARARHPDAAACSTPAPRSRRSSSTVAWPRSCATASRAESRPSRLRLVEGDALDQDLLELVAPPYDVVANLPYHVTSPILHRAARRDAAAGAARADGPARGRRADRGAPGRDELPVGLRPVPRPVRDRPRASRRRRSSRSPGRVGGHRRRAVRRRRPPRRRRRGRALAAGPGGRSASGARCSTTCSRGSSPSSRDGSTPRSPPPASTPDRRPQTLAVGEWIALLAALGRSAGSRGRRA